MQISPGIVSSVSLAKLISVSSSGAGAGEVWADTPCVRCQQTGEPRAGTPALLGAAHTQGQESFSQISSHLTCCVSQLDFSMGCCIRNMMLRSGLIVLHVSGVLRSCPSLLGVAEVLLGCIAGIALGDSVVRLLH